MIDGRSPVPACLSVLRWSLALGALALVTALTALAGPAYAADPVTITMARTADMLTFDHTKPATYPNGRVFTDDVIDHRLAFLSKGDIPPTGLKPHTDILATFPYIGPPHQKKA